MDLGKDDLGRGRVCSGSTLRKRNKADPMI
jgi:hypothetical protein